MDCARNIITANFSGGGTSATTAPLWQWDYGQVLCITGIDLPAAFEVHFSTNRTGGVSTVAVGADGQVTIPNALLTIGKNLNAWIYLSDAQGEGETEYSILIPVKARPMPETYDAEATGEFDDVVRQVSEYAETAQTAADNAGASATAAAASASEAAASASAAETAKNAAVIAQGKAEDAQAAATSAAQTATQKAQQTAQDAAQAAQSKADAESAAGRAEAAETGAESAKTDAETAAQGAAASASAASASSTSAGQAATSAGQSATAAAGSATTAENAAQTATTKAGEASASASAAAASETAAQTAQSATEMAAGTATASATTATTKAAEAAQSASNAAASETAAEAAATRAEQAAASLTVDNALSETSENPVQNKVITGEITNVKTAIDALKITDTASGAVASFSDGADNLPLKSLVVDINPIQDLSHGDPSPENICPISGHDTVEVLDDPACGGTIEWNQLVINGNMESNDGWLSAPQASGAFSVSNNILTCTMTEEARYLSIINYGQTQRLVKGHKYLYSVNVRSSAWADSSYRAILILGGYWAQAISADIQAGTWVNISGIFTSTIEDTIQATFRKYPDANYSPFDLKEFMVFDLTQMFGAGNEPATVEAFRALFPNDYYEDTTGEETCVSAVNGNPYRHITIPLGQTVYGGTLDVVSGELVVDRAKKTLSQNDSFTLSQSATRNRIAWDGYESVGKIRGLFVSNALKSMPASSGGYGTSDWEIWGSTIAPRCWISVPLSYTIDDFKEFLSSDPIEIVYELATPITYHLTPQEVRTLLGTNNVWSDGDSVTVEYVADPKLYIDKKITAAVAALA